MENNSIITNELVIKYFSQEMHKFYGRIELLDTQYNNLLKLVLSNMEYIYTNFEQFINESFLDYFRYVDYFSTNSTALENLEYFEQYYDEIDKKQRSLQFLLYCLMNQLVDLFNLYDEFKNEHKLSELLELLDDGMYYQNLIFFSNELKQKLDIDRTLIIEQQNITPKFLSEDTAYKIFFTGFSLDDITKLPKNVQIQLINKLYTPLSTEKVIPKSEAIDHVKEAYDFPISRIQFADDYRIAYIRKNNVTAILGVTIKTGKEKDYNRYDSIAKKQNDIYTEIKSFSENRIPNNHIHYKVIELLKKRYEEKKKKR